MDRYCESFYHPTQCLPGEIEDEAAQTKIRMCYCNRDYCNSAAVSWLQLASLSLSLIAFKLMHLCYDCKMFWR